LFSFFLGIFHFYDVLYFDGFISFFIPWFFLLLPVIKLLMGTVQVFNIFMIFCIFKNKNGLPN